jgi:uncharacterized protein YjbI with pentapeptide repeats
MKLADSETYRDLDLAGGELAGATGVTIERSRLRGVSLAGTRLRMFQLRDVRFEDCDLSGVELDTGRLERCELHGCRLTGGRLVDVRAPGLVLAGCAGRYLQLERLEARGALIDRCELGEATILDCALDGAELRGTDLRGSVIEGGSWDGANLRGCGLEGLRVALETLRGATVDPAQAAALLQSAGIRVDPA